MQSDGSSLTLIAKHGPESSLKVLQGAVCSRISNRVEKMETFCLASRFPLSLHELDAQIATDGMGRAGQGLQSYRGIAGIEKTIKRRAACLHGGLAPPLPSTM